MMKKVILICVGIVCAIALLLGVFFISRTSGAQIAEGTYHVKDCEAYPDASIIVKGNTIQFSDIDLNAIYQDAQIETYKKIKESGVETGMTDEQIEEACDLNQMFVSGAYQLDYESMDEGNKTGTFAYVYYCYEEQNIFGLVLEYDSFHKTLQINSPVETLVFEK